MMKKCKLKRKRNELTKSKTYRCTLMKYTFYHGRHGLAFIYGLSIGMLLAFLVTRVVFAVPFLYAPYGYSFVYTGIIIMLPTFAPVIYMLYLPPDWTRINVKCIGIFHNDRVEIHKGKRIRIQSYVDIKRVFKLGIHSDAWYFGKVSIHEPVGSRKKHTNSKHQLDKFLKTLENKVKMAKKQI